jgi:hypothetical protein
MEVSEIGCEILCSSLWPALCVFVCVMSVPLGIGLPTRKKDEHQYMFVSVQNVWWIQLVSLTLLCQSFPLPEWAQSISWSAIIIIWNWQCEPATWKSLMSEDQHGRDIAPVLVSQLLHVGGDGCSGNWNLRVFSFLAPSLIPLQYFPQISGSTEFRNWEPHSSDLSPECTNTKLVAWYF